MLPASLRETIENASQQDAPLLIECGEELVCLVVSPHKYELLAGRAGAVWERGSVGASATSPEPRGRHDPGGRTHRATHPASPPIRSPRARALPAPCGRGHALGCSHGVGDRLAAGRACNFLP
jgi:hypothetical protein